MMRLVCTNEYVFRLSNMGLIRQEEIDIATAPLATLESLDHSSLSAHQLELITARFLEKESE